MENRLKERLTGAAILVALVVLLVPEMFRGQRGEVATSSGSNAEGPPIRSYTIDLSNGPGTTVPLQPASTPPAAAAAESEPSAVSAAEASVTKSAPATVPASLPAPTPASATHVHAAAHAAVPAGAWSVQLGIFAKRENAERLARAAHAKGFAVSVGNADPKGLFHVDAGAAADRGAAQALASRLKSQGFSAAVIAPP
jgi:DedD protein